MQSHHFRSLYVEFIIYSNIQFKDGSKLRQAKVTQKRGRHTRQGERRLRRARRKSNGDRCKTTRGRLEQ